MSRGDRDNWQSAASAFSKGDLMINPSFGTVTYVNNSIEMVFNPSLGLFLSDQTLINVSLHGSFAERFNSEIQYRNAYLSIAPYLRHYFGSNQKHWRWFGQAGFILAGSDYDTSTADINSSTFLLNSRWGANWFLTPNLAFDLGVDINYHLYTNRKGSILEDSFDEPSPNRGFRVGASVGVQYFLQR
jgi:hypothetical protein